MNPDITKYRLFRVVTVFGCSLLPFSCVQDDDVACNSESEEGNVSLQMKVDAAGDNNGTIPTDDEAKIHSLRVYAFADIPADHADADKDGRLVGYYYTDKPARYHFAHFRNGHHVLSERHAAGKLLYGGKRGCYVDTGC